MIEEFASHRVLPAHLLEIEVLLCVELELCLSIRC